MSERDRMAIEMLRVVLHTTKDWNEDALNEWYYDGTASAAELAYRLADAMLRAKRDTPAK
jgi:hypothetical protein